jgi:tetratricopeptide (TPR) repeat protein
LYRGVLALGLLGLGFLHGNTWAQASEVIVHSPDTTGIWYHINEKQTELANAEFKRLQQKYPNWRVPEALSIAIEQLNSPTPEPPVYTEQQRQLDEQRKFIGEIAGLNEEQWRDLSPQRFNRFRLLITKNQDPDLQLLLGWIYLAKKAPQQALQQFEFVKAQFSDSSENSQQGIDSALALLVKQAVSQGNLDKLTKLNTTYMIEDIVDGLAWTAFDTQDYAQAQVLFDYLNDKYGSTLALERLGEQQAAYEQACANTHIATLAVYCVDKLSERQLEAYNQQDFHESVIIADKIANITSLNKDTLALKGFALLELEEFQRSADVFAQLLDLEPENTQYAEVLYSAANNLPLEQQATLRQQFPQLTPYFSAQTATLGFARKQFDLSYAKDGEHYEDRRSLSIYTGLRGSQRSGDSGLGEFDQFNHYLGITQLISDWRLSARLDYELLYAGLPDEGARFGSEPFAAGQSFDTGVNGQGISISAFKQYDDGNFYADLRYLLFDQPADTDITGQLAATWFIGDTTVAASLYRLRKKDSLLSTAGAVAQDGQVFGGVVATGIKGLFVKPVSESWALALTGEYAELSGQNVADNRLLAASIGIGKDIKNVFNFPLDYLRVGPRFSYFGYQENLSLFTLSQGGYFSPDVYFNAAAYAQLLTQEGRNWQIKGDIDIGYASITEANTFFDLGTQLDAFEGQKSQGFSANLRLEGQWKIAKHWVLSGVLVQSNAVSFNSTNLGIQIRWQPSFIRGLTSDWLIDNNPRQTGYGF